MKVYPRKRLEISERQARILELYHQKKTCRQISEIMTAEAKINKKRGWGLHFASVAREIAKAIEYYRQEAVEFFEDRLLRELALADEGQKLAAQAWEESRRVKKERTSTGEGGTGSASDELTTAAPDAEHSREMREWQNQRLKLLELVLKNRQKQQTTEKAEGTDEPKRLSPEEALRPYFETARIFSESVHRQSATNLPPESPRQ